MRLLKIMSPMVAKIRIITCRALEGVVFEFGFDGFCIIDFKFLEPDGWMELLRLSADEKASD